MNLYQIVDVDGNVVTGPMGYAEAQRYMQKNRMSRNEYTLETYMPVKRETETVASKKELPIFRTMLDAGIEFTSKLTDPGYMFVAFRTEHTAREIMESMNLQGFTVEICGNPTWIKIKQDY